MLIPASVLWDLGYFLYISELHLHYYPSYLASERELPWINGT